MFMVIIKKIKKNISNSEKIKVKSKTKGVLKAIKKKKIVVKPKVTKRLLKKKIKDIPKRKIPKEPEVYIKLKKVSHNPIISPSFYSWESKATFNPAAFEDNGKIYLLYRAVGDDDSSVIGYALTYDGLNIEDRPSYFVYKRVNNYSEKEQPLDYFSGGGWNGGCEDPRIALIDGHLYMTYTAFDGWGSVRVALTSISLSDFKKKKWNWKNEVLISPPDGIYKNWVIFPEKINGKFAIMHSISPDILIDYVDSMDEFNGKKFIKSIHQNHPQWQFREKGVRGVGPTPIKTKEGWLVLYHKTESHDPNRYKLFAMLLDLKDPTRILYKSLTPILEPEEDYENNGLKWGIVYSCGAVVKKGELFVYYGGSDTFVCVATINLSELLNDLKKDKIIKLKTIRKLIK